MRLELLLPNVRRRDKGRTMFESLRAKERLNDESWLNVSPFSPYFCNAIPHLFSDTLKQTVFALNVVRQANTLQNAFFERRVDQWRHGVAL